MARSHSESYPAPSLTESGPAAVPGFPGPAPSAGPRAATRGARGPDRSRLLWAALALGACVVAAFVIPAFGVAHGRAFAAAGAVAALLLAGVLIVLYQRYDEALADVARRHDAAVANVAGWEQGVAEQHRRETELQQRAGEQESRYRAMTAGMSAALGELLNSQIPDALTGFATSQGYSDSPARNDIGALCDRIAAAVAEGVAKLLKQHDDQVESSRLAVLKLARLLQDSAWRIQAEATKMTEAHSADPDVLESSNRVDHAAAQQARHAQSLAVLCGEWPGRQWPEPLPLQDVVRAAAGRIVPYERVKVSGDPAIAAAASINEPLIHLIAELLANATQSSPPTTDVEVTVRAVQRGAVIEIDDGGVGMNDAQFDQAREMISGRRLIGLGDLGEVPQTGLAVIGHYVERYGFRADLRPSPYGGVRAIVLVPDDKVENLEPAVALAPPPIPEQAGVPEADGTDTEYLPRRRSLRGQVPPDRHADPAPAEQPAALGRTPEQDGKFLDEFLRFGATAATPDDDSTEMEQ
ncbi:MAG: ATP-binding protein [Streptosporangiaceae bacterium]